MTLLCEVIVKELFKTYKIYFKDRKEFNKAVDMNNLADDIGYADMILTYSNEFLRDRFLGYLSSSGFVSTTIV